MSSEPEERTEEPMREEDSTPEALEPSRRTVLGTAATVSVGLAAASAGGLGLGFLWPTDPPEPVAIFACLTEEVRYGRAKEVMSPRGEPIYLTRIADDDDPTNIVAIGTTCSHLGCRVFYRPDREADRRFHCPCHQGFFDELGNPTGGPPETPLARFDVEVRGSLLFIRYAHLTGV